MLQALGLFCMGLSSRRGCRAEMLAQYFHFQKCTTLHTKPPIFDIVAIPPGPHAISQSDFNNTLICVASTPAQIENASQFCRTSELVCECPYRIGGIARIRRFEFFEWRVLHFWSYAFQTAKMAGGMVFLGVLGCSWGAPVGHVTAALACYSRPGMIQDPLQLSFLLGSCSWFALASLLIAFELVLLG